MLPRIVSTLLVPAMLLTASSKPIFADNPIPEGVWSEYLILYQHGGRVRQDGFTLEAQKGFTGGKAGAWFEFDFVGTGIEILGQYENASYDVQVDGNTVLIIRENDPSNVVNNNNGSALGNTLFRITDIPPHPVQGNSHTLRMTKTSSHGNILSTAIIRDSNRPVSESPWIKWEKRLNLDSATVNFILDTDMNTDVDDAGAHAMLLSAAQLRPDRVKILAVIVSEAYAYSAPAIDAYNRYYGFDNIPVGTNKDTNRGIHGLPGQLTYTNVIANTFYHELPNNGWGAPDANEVYRNALAQANNNSVVIVVIGVPEALFNLYKTPANWNDDGHPSGKELVDSKVKLIACMCNHAQGAGFSDYPIVDVPQLHSTIGSWVMTGGRRNEMESDNPIRVSYDSYCPPGRDGSMGLRDSWDLVVMDYALHGLSDHYFLQRGKILDAPNPRMKAFVADNEGKVAYLMYRRWENQIKERLNEQIIAGKRGALPPERRVTVDSQNPAIIADGFTHLNRLEGGEHLENAEWYSFHSVLRSTAANSTLTYEFTGSGIEIYGGGTGTIAVSIDGKQEKMIKVSENRGVGSNGGTRNVISGRLFRKEFETAEPRTLVIKTMDGSDVSIDHFKMINPAEE